MSSPALFEWGWGHSAVRARGKCRQKNAGIHIDTIILNAVCLCVCVCVIERRAAAQRLVCIWMVFISYIAQYYLVTHLLCPSLPHISSKKKKASVLVSCYSPPPPLGFSDSPVSYRGRRWDRVPHRRASWWVILPSDAQPAACQRTIETPCHQSLLNSFTKRRPSGRYWCPALSKPTCPPTPSLLVTRRRTYDWLSQEVKEDIHWLSQSTQDVLENKWPLFLEAIEAISWLELFFVFVTFQLL